MADHSIKTLIAPGGSNTFAVNFTLGYLEEADVTCRVGVEASDRNITWLSENSALVDGAVIDIGTEVKFTRTTDQTELDVSFSDGVPINKKNLDRNFKQVIMLMHEVLDGRVVGVTIRASAGAPLDTLGDDGDVHISGDTGDVSIREAGAYVVQANIKGPKGDEGDPAIDGIDGSVFRWVQGGWQPGVEYSPDDGISNNGSSYFCIGTNTDVQPGVTAGWATYWEVLAAAGADGTGTMDSFNTRSGAVIAQVGDYTYTQVTGAMGSAAVFADNELARSDGTARAMVGAGVFIDDNKDVTGMRNMTMTGNFTFDGAAVRPDATGVMFVSGGVSAALGASIGLYGNNHATKAGDIEWRSDGASKLIYDHSTSYLLSNVMHRFNGGAEMIEDDTPSAAPTGFGRFQFNTTGNPTAVNSAGTVITLGLTGANLAAANAALLNVENQVVTGGATITVKDLGAFSTGTHTMDVGDRPMQKLECTGAFVLAPGATIGSCVLIVTNGTGAGVIDVTGWDKVDGAFNTTVGNWFTCSVVLGGTGRKHLIINAGQ